MIDRILILFVFLTLIIIFLLQRFCSDVLETLFWPFITVIFTGVTTLLTRATYMREEVSLNIILQPMTASAPMIKDQFPESAQSLANQGVNHALVLAVTNQSRNLAILKALVSNKAKMIFPLVDPSFKGFGHKLSEGEQKIVVIPLNRQAIADIMEARWLAIEDTSGRFHKISRKTKKELKKYIKQNS